MSDYKLYLGDCLDFMRGMDAGSVDAVITDPPYGIGYSRDSRKTAGKWLDGTRIEGKTAAPLIGDDKPFDPIPIIGIGKKHILFGASAYSEKLPSNYGWIIWDKQIKGDWSGGDAETAWTDFLNSNRIHRQRWQGVMREGDECPFIGGGLVHPTQKPAALMRFCILL